MVARAVLAALCALYGRQAAAGSDGPGGPVSLVQSGVRVHSSAAWHPAKGSFLVDNTELQHKGPGVLLRRSKNLSDTVGRDRFAKWGAVVEGTDTADGWVQYQTYYLPTFVRGVRVITPQDVRQEAPTPQPHRKRIRIHYAPTELRSTDGTWIPCQIASLGSKPETYNIHVKPRKFAAYNMTNVPVQDLKKVQRIREFIPVKNPPPAPVAAKLARDVAEREAGGSISFKVQDHKGKVMELRMFKSSPMRTMMKMSCERAKVSWFKCQRHMRFVWNHNPLHEDDHSSALGMPDGETVVMVPF